MVDDIMGYYSIKDELNRRVLSGCVQWLEFTGLDVRDAHISNDGKRINVTILLKPVINNITIKFTL